MSDDAAVLVAVRARVQQAVQARNDEQIRTQTLSHILTTRQTTAI
jgi:hypothetical protein